MIGRHGNMVRVGWAPHHLVWLEAALSLPYFERHEALKDIAALTGRSPESIRWGITQIRNAREKAEEVLVSVPARKVAAKLSPSQLRPPTRAQLMGGRATGRRPFLEAAE